jgi:predicted DNA binding CopG/RHH family protein
MDQDKIDRLRDYYDTTDVAGHFADATIQTDRATEVPTEAPVSLSVRLPQSLMDQVRAQAADLGIPATALMRQWITERVATPAALAVISVADLQRFIAEHAHSPAS